MKKEILLLTATALCLTGGALAQPSATAEGSATTRSDASAGAGRDGARIAGQSETTGQVAAEGAAQQASGRFAQGTEFDATLERPVDARRAREGDEVRATLNETVRSDDGVVIEQGSTIVGRVTAATEHRRATRAREGVASTLAIVFEKAILSDGRELPMNATIQALAAAQSATDARLGGDERGRADARSRTSGQGSARGGAAPAGSGIGGIGATAGGVAGGIAGGATGTAGAATDRAGSTVEGAARAGTRAGAEASRSSASAAGSAVARAGASAGATGGLGADGRFASGTRGAFGMDGIEIAGQASGSAQASVIRSESGNVRLGSGTRLLLVTEASASGR